MRALALFLATLLITPAAFADFTPEQRQSDFSAFNMNQGEIRLGLFQEEYAIFDQWAAGIYLAPWIIFPIARAPVISAYTKVEILDVGPPDHDRFALALKANFLFADVSNVRISGIEEDQFKATVLPLSIIGSYVIDKVWTASLEAKFIQTWLGGNVESVGAGEVAGISARRNFQLAAFGEARLHRHVALNLVVRYAPWVEPLQVQADVNQDDGSTTHINAQVAADVSGRAWLIQPGISCSWGIFNVQAAVGYGYVFAPGVHLVGDIETVVPDLDVYFRF